MPPSILAGCDHFRSVIADTKIDKQMLLPLRNKSFPKKNVNASKCAQARIFMGYVQGLYQIIGIEIVVIIQKHNQVAPRVQYSRAPGKRNSGSGLRDDAQIQRATSSEDFIVESG